MKLAHAKLLSSFLNSKSKRDDGSKIFLYDEHAKQALLSIGWVSEGKRAARDMLITIIYRLILHSAVLVMIVMINVYLRE